jgi:hypothetical protein
MIIIELLKNELEHHESISQMVHHDENEPLRIALSTISSEEQE